MTVSKEKKRKSKRQFEQLDSIAEETHNKLEKLAGELVATKKRVKKQKTKNSSRNLNINDASCDLSNASSEFSFED